jgi:hypothetical protein
MTDLIKLMTEKEIGAVGECGAVRILKVVRRNARELFASSEYAKASEMLSEESALIAVISAEYIGCTVL